MAKMTLSLAILAVILLHASSVAAFWRMECQFETGLGRIDPIVDPGQISSHVHTFAGGAGIDNFTASFATLQAAGSCTSCYVIQDHSAYWTPALYFVSDNGTASIVPQVGGMLAYYLPYLSNITAFPEGFQMIAGNPYIRNFTGPFPDDPLSSWPTDSTGDQFFLQQRALGFNCLNYAVAPEPSLYRHVLPSKAYMDANCLDGLRLELAFPSCGNGELDSSDHRSHMAYPSLVKEGNCPDGYDVVHYPFLYFETIWATNDFAGEEGMFILSNGDPVGTGYHGDFIMGWESQGFLQNALDTCTNLSGQIQDCPLFNLQSDSDSANCRLQIPDVLLDDECHGPRQGLPVDIPIQYGPAQATTYPIAGQSGQPTTLLQATTVPSTFSNRPTLPYSPANPTSTSTALGGIVVALETSLSTTTSSIPTPSAESGGSADIITTTTWTRGNEVMELLIAEATVTETSTVVATTTVDGVNAVRHLHRHAHRHVHI